MSLDRAEPPTTGEELTTLRAFLDYFRTTIRMKASGLGREDLARALPPSDLTLAGLVKHLAFVEDYWFGEILRGEPADDPWAAVDWSRDPDWELTSATEHEPADLWQLYDDAVARSQTRLTLALAAGGADQLSLGAERGRDRFTLRWILVHLVEEYARHCGHADLIRQSIDGSTGD